MRKRRRASAATGGGGKSPPQPPPPQQQQRWWRRRRQGGGCGHTFWGGLVQIHGALGFNSDVSETGFWFVILGYVSIRPCQDPETRLWL